MQIDDKTTDAAADESCEELSPHNIIDTVVFGRRLRAARILNGFDRVTEFTILLRSRYGIDISDRTVYAIERGEQMPNLDFFVAALALLMPDVGYFFPAIRGDVVEILKNAKHL